MSIKETVAALNAIEHSDSITSIHYDFWLRKWHIHMPLERFVELFDEWSTTKHDKEYERLSVDCAGVEVFALRRLV